MHYRLLRLLWWFFILLKCFLDSVPDNFTGVFACILKFSQTDSWWFGLGGYISIVRFCCCLFLDNILWNVKTEHWKWNVLFRTSVMLCFCIWGVLANKLGRKVVLVVGLIISILIAIPMITGYINYVILIAFYMGFPMLTNGIFPVR